jgi:hypothetical protein
MDPIIAHMKVLTIHIDNGEAMVPFVDGQISRSKPTQTTKTVSGNYLTVHVALGVLTCLMVMALHG